MKRREDLVLSSSAHDLNILSKVTGEGVYTDDIQLPRMLYGAFLGSPFSCARIVDIDTSRIRKIPGVRVVLTGRDLPVRFGHIIADRPVLAIDRVAYYGEPVVAVAAETAEIAYSALQEARVEYEPLTGIFGPEEAMSGTAGVIHPDLLQYWRERWVRPDPQRNICHEFHLSIGSTVTALKYADLVLEETYNAFPVQHAYLEPHIVIAKSTLEGSLQVIANAQSPFVLQRIIARAFGKKFGEVRVIVPNVGGGFGGKLYPSIEPLAVALALQVKGRPVKLALKREDEFLVGPTRHPLVAKIKTGVKSDGTILGREMNLMWDTGAYADCGPAVAWHAAIGAGGPYRIQAQTIDSYCINTNNPVASAFRGYGVTQVTWACECHTDVLARKLGLDPVDFRLKNTYISGDQNANGQKLVAVSVREMLRDVQNELDKKGVGRENETSQTIVSGQGVAIVYMPTVNPSLSTAIVSIQDDGSVTVLCSTVDMGQGTAELMARIAADELNVQLEDVRVPFPDTLYSPYDDTTSASRSTFFMGNAVRMAAQDCRRQLEIIAGVGIQGNWAKIIREHFRGRGGAIIGQASYYASDGTAVDQLTGQGKKASAFWMFGVQGAKVQVDLETGRIKVLRIVAAHDVGKAISQEGCRKQVEGGVVMGVGTTLYEKIQLDKGKTVNPNLHDYRLVTAADVPEIEIKLWETPEPEGPHGARGLGEATMGPTAAAICNAVYQALGVQTYQLPINSERLLDVFHSRRRANPQG